MELKPLKLVDFVSHPNHPNNYSRADHWRRSWEMRRAAIESEGFTRLNKQLVLRLSNLIGNREVVEVCAGTGYVAAALAAAGVKIRALDNQTETHVVDADENVSFWTEFYHPIENVDATQVPHFDEQVVLMCWPPYASDVAVKVARKLRPGQILIALTEGRGGCIADDDFFDEVEDNQRWLSLTSVAEELNECHLCDSGVYDRWSIYARLGN